LPIDANVSSGESGRPGGSAGFSRNPRIFVPPGSAPSTSITPNSVALARGTRMPATVNPAPVCKCCLSIGRGSIR